MKVDDTSIFKKSGTSSRTCSAFVLYSILSFALGIYNYQPSRQVKYEGCMKKTDMSMEFHKLSLKQGSKAINIDVFICIKECWLLRNRVAALQKGSECVCSASIIDAIKVTEADCNRRCKGNCYQTCGGQHVLSVYQTGYMAEQHFEIDKAALLSAKIGCYDASSSRSVLCDSHFAQFKTVRMTVAMCVFYCDSIHQTQFATLCSVDSCCCSNSVTGAKNTNMEWCNIPCSGSASIGCVGNFLAVQWSTFQLSRLPSFKRYSKETFTEADWAEPVFPAGESFTNLKPKLVQNAEDGSLSGLMAKKMARESSGQDWKNDGMVGQDKREPEREGVENSVAVLDVPNKVQESSEDYSLVIIIAAVVTGFAVFTAAFGFYIFRRRRIMNESKNVNANAQSRGGRKPKVRRKRASDKTTEHGKRPV